MTVNIEGRTIGDSCPTFIVAEIGQNHNGDMAIAKQLIKMAADSNADAVKFQKRDIKYDLTEEAYHKPYDNPNSFGATYGEHREFLELSVDQHKELRNYALDHNLLYFCTACDPPSVETMEDVGNPIYKVASRDLTNIPLLRVISKTRKPVILSTGMAGLPEISQAIDELGEGPEWIILLQCVSQYPLEIEKVNLLAMHTMRNKYNVLVGLSDHTTGFIASVAASVLGACIVEKHITLSRAMKGTDHPGSLEDRGLRLMVNYIRHSELAMGDGKKEFDPVARVAMNKLARSLTSKINIPTNTILEEDMLVLKSPGNGISWHDRFKVIGKRSLREIGANETILEADFE